MPHGIRKDGTRSLPPLGYGDRGQAEKFKELRLPNLLKRTSVAQGRKMKGFTKWKKLADQLPAIEEELCAWEAANPDAYRALPWFEAREAFKALKDAGLVVWPEWWELAGAANHAGWAAHTINLEQPRIRHRAKKPKSE